MEVIRLERDDLATRHDYYQPIYRVDFWERCAPPAGSDPEKMGYRQDSYRIRGAKSVHEVRAWASGSASRRQFVIWIELGPANGRTIARVEGVDPTNLSQQHLAE